MLVLALFFFFQAAAKSFTKPIAKGYLIKQKDKGKWEKRYCVVESGHLFYYKTPNVPLLPAQRSRARSTAHEHEAHTSFFAPLFSFFLSPPRLCGKQDAKPTGVLPLREYFLKEAKDEKKKSAGWDLLSVKEVIPPGNHPVRPRRVCPGLPAIRSQTHTHTQPSERCIPSRPRRTRRRRSGWPSSRSSPLPCPQLNRPSSCNHRSAVVTDRGLLRYVGGGGQHQQ